MPSFQTAAGKGVPRFGVGLLIPGGEERTPLRRRVALPHSRHQITDFGRVLPFWVTAHRPLPVELLPCQGCAFLCLYAPSLIHEHMREFTAASYCMQRC
jgi:hypothetical protein